MSQAAADLEIQPTADGSPTLFSRKFDAAYHSQHGALQESRHVFIQHGWQFFLEKLENNAAAKTDISLLEIGFGTGLNIWLAATEALRTNLMIDCLTLETDPVQPEIWEKLDYPARAGRPDLQPIFEKIHRAEWQQRVEIFENFQLEKRCLPVEQLAENQRFDLVFFDAFAPSAQPELWQEPVLKKVFDAMRSGAVLTTFCSQGNFRRALQAVGFEVEKLPGPPGKREMIRASKS